VAALASAQGRARLTPEAVHGEPALQGAVLSDLTWHPDGRRVTFLRQKNRLAAYHLESGRESVLFSLDEGGRPATLNGYRWSPRGHQVAVVAQDDLYLVAEDGTVRRVTHDAETEEFPEFSPSGARLAYVRAGDLYVYDVDQRRDWRLTRRTSPDVRNGRLDWVYEEELASRSGRSYWWSPDSRAIAYLHIDSSPSPIATLADLLAPAAAPVRQRFPTPGDPNPIASLGIVTLEADGRPGREVLLPLRDAEYLVPQIAWAPDGRRLLFQALNRKQNRLELRQLDVERSLKTGRAADELVLTESDPAWINILGAPVLLKDRRTFLWLSERQGPRHLYRCALADGACQPLTRGEWSVEQVAGVDEGRGVAYVTAAHPRPRERQLYSVALSGDPRLTRLTVEDGTHDVQIAPGGGAFLDTRSTAVVPPNVHVVTLPALGSRAVETNVDAPIGRYDTGDAEWVDVRAPDGTTLHGRLIRPSGAAGGPRRPAVVSIYGGPHAQMVRDKWANSAIERLLASHGFVVWSLDNRGAGGRGHRFESPLRGELGRTELADQLAGVEHLKSLPYVDGKRLGIVGTSYGGYMSLYAAVHAPDVFRAVAAGAPVTDWRRYDSIYTERYLGLPADNGAGYEKSSILGRAAAIRSRLLLFHGTADDNVHLSHTVRLIAELHKAGVAHEVALHPGEMHGYRATANKVARDRAILDFFLRTLGEPGK
jgi:dipeptidyl-peptidase 4